MERKPFICVNCGGEGEVRAKRGELVVNVNLRRILEPDFRCARDGRRGLDFIKKQPGQSIVICNSDQLPFASESVDSVVAFSVPVDKTTFAGQGYSSIEMRRIKKRRG